MRFKPRISLQFKLLLSLLTMVAIAGIGMSLVGKSILARSIIQQAYEYVGQTLEMYSDMYDNRLYVKHRLINTVASYPELQADVAAKNRAQIFRVVKELLKESTFDILNVTDERGVVLVRSNNLELHGDSVANDAYVRHVLAKNVPASGFDVMDQEALRREDAGLEERALIPIVPTEQSRSLDRKIESRGLFLKAACPIHHQGRLVGVIYGALLLNHDTTIPDRARSLVFGDQRIDDREIGTATLFLGDVRISTNVRDKDGRRAIGTLVSDRVYRRVFEDGATWKDKAFVVDRWFIAAYKPVRDLNQQIVGIMYTGIMEEKYERIERSALISLVLLVAFCCLVAFGLAYYLVHNVVSPIRALVKTAEEISAGRYSRVQIRSDDEMGYLAKVFNNMLDALAAKEKQVAENMEKQILQTEKLASLGRLASGIAHEINNPLTGVLSYTDVLLEEFAETEHAEDLRVIKAETLRCREIVRGILDFARETKLEPERVNLNRVVADVLTILEKHVAFQNIKVVQLLDKALPEIDADVNQLKSVISNLAVNAADAMPGGGTLTITTRMSSGGDDVLIQVQDTGHGISPENLGRVFDPFFTTKETGKGTGLGLAVTFGIVKRHNGVINVTSELNKGTTVEIRLPVSPGAEVS